FRYACRRVDDSEWTRGFNLPSAQGSSSGDSFSAKSIGHLGFTGVSFWIDLEKELIIVLLTNRVVKGDDLTGIRTMRPDMHNKIVEYLYRKELPPERYFPGG
ncbi:MAG: serine hydrolase, partial [Deltaproteobacteria bacterium]|nr:serine hydrolase [Deltaproteobacteria bacterium]